MKPQIIKKDGKPEYAVVPYDEYIKLVEAAEDTRDAKEPLDEVDLVPVEVLDRLIAGENPIKVWREFRSLTQAELAQQVNIAVPYLSQLENEDRVGSIEVLKAIADKLQITIDDLLRE